MLSNFNNKRTGLRNLTVTVNGRELDAKNGETVMELCDRNHIKIPRLCHHPNIPPRASCRVCLVECDGKWLSPACVTQVWDGLKISTQSKTVTDAVRANLKMLLAAHDERCTSCVSNAKCQFRDMVYAYGVDCKEREPPAPNAVDRTTNAIQLDLAKCVLCGRCVRVCEHVTGLNALQFARRGDKMTVEPAAGKQLKDTNCIQCGQCTLYCPVGACTEKNQAREVLNSIRNHVDKIMVAIVDPTVKINISDEMGLPAGTDSTGNVVSYLKQLGFDLVFDGAVGDDLMVQEEADLFVKRLKENKSKLPLFSSTCPAFVNFVEQSKPDLIKHLSTTRSPQAMMSSLVKNCLAKNWTGLTLHPEDFYCLTINSCVARKDEIERPAFVTPSGVKETDAAITTRELAQMMKLSNVKFYKLPQAEFSNIYNEGTGAAALLGTTGGLTEAMLRVAYEKATGKKLENVEFNALHGMNKVRVAEVDFAGQSVKVAVVDGISNARNLIEKIEAGDPTVKDVRYVEVLACPGGCVNGGGSPKFQDPAVMEKRANALHFVDEHKKLRKSSENPIVTNLLAGDLKDTKLVHQLLHTSFKARPKQ